MVCWGRPHHFKFFKGWLPQILLGPFLNTLPQIILCLEAAHASNLTRTASGLFWLTQRVKIFCVIRKFLPANIFGNFLFDSPSFINTYFNVRNL